MCIRDRIWRITTTPETKSAKLKSGGAGHLLTASAMSKVHNGPRNLDREVSAQTAVADQNRQRKILVSSEVRGKLR